MSTKCSIKWDKAGDGVGYHLYTDVMDTHDEGEPPVYLELNGVRAEMYTLENGASVTVTIPADIARALGLLPQLPQQESDK
jgi:hypothetical protein